eukprot:174126-Pelagomonas_calceolata.AAC.3
MQLHPGRVSKLPSCPETSVLHNSACSKMRVGFLQGSRFLLTRDHDHPEIGCTLPCWSGGTAVVWLFCQLEMSQHFPTISICQMSVNDFDLRAVMYHGSMSIVYHAVDKRSGVTVALKLYKRHKLTSIERHQVSLLGVCQRHKTVGGAWGSAQAGGFSALHEVIHLALVSQSAENTDKMSTLTAHMLPPGSMQLLDLPPLTRLHSQECMNRLIWHAGSTANYGHAGSSTEPREAGMWEAHQNQGIQTVLHSHMRDVGSIAINHRPLNLFWHWYKQVAREIKLHIGLAHPSIISLYAAWKDRNYVYMALEWAPGGDVYSYLHGQGGKLTEEVAVTLILEPFLSGLEAIHAQWLWIFVIYPCETHHSSQFQIPAEKPVTDVLACLVHGLTKGLIHRDIKPENILLNRSRLKRMLGHMELNCATNHMSRLGTIDYLAPEILDCPVKQNPQDNKHDPSIGGKQNQRHWAYFTKRILAPGCRCIFTGSL